MINFANQRNRIFDLSSNWLTSALIALTDGYELSLALVDFWPLIFEIQYWSIFVIGAGCCFSGNLQAAQETTSYDHRMCTAAQRGRGHVSHLLQGKIFLSILLNYSR